MFDRVIVVSLRRRMDRLGQFWARLEQTGWPFKTPIVFEAIDGEKIPVPSGVSGGNQWKSGGGAWGCMQSHRQILEHAILEGVDSLLVLEDDAYTVDSFPEKAAEFVKNLPSNWDGLMLGGQHMGSPPSVVPGIVKCQNCQRTHAYAVRGKYMRDLYALWHSYFGHCDHVMGPFQARYNVYAPDPFLIGQGSTRSDISGRLDPLRMWSGTELKAEIALISAPHAIIRDLRPLGVHTGYTRDPGTDIDVGIRDIFLRPDSYISRVRKLRQWAEMVRGEASAFENGLCVIWLPEINDEVRQVCRKAIGNELIELNVNSVAEFIRSRMNGDRKHNPQRPCGCGNNAAG